jgi:hypothetical protein
MAIRQTRTARDAAAGTEAPNTYYGMMGREPDASAMHDIRHGLRWLLAGVFAFFLGVVLGEVWPETGTGPRSAGPRTAHNQSTTPPAPVVTEVVEVGTHRLAVPARMLSGGEVSAARRSRGGFVTHLAWVDPENPTSEASRRCVESRPRCRESLTMVVTGSRVSAEQQWANALRGMAQIGGGDAYGVRFYTAAPGADGRPGGSLEFGERAHNGRTVYGRCPRSRRDVQAGPANTPLARQTATVDPGANCTLTFDVRPGLSVTLLVRGEKLAEWRRAQLAAATLVQGFFGGGAASRA